MFFFKSNSDKDAKSLVTERENKGILFIIFMAILGVIGIITYAFQTFESAKATVDKTTYFYSICAILFFTAGANFTFFNLIGFLFGIPRIATSENTHEPKSNYQGNDNLLQVSDWLTKIILGVGLTQLTQLPAYVNKVAHFIVTKGAFGNEPLVIFVIIYFACLGFLFGYLWTRLYFIRMLRNSDSEIDNRTQNDPNAIANSTSL